MANKRPIGKKCRWGDPFHHPSLPGRVVPLLSALASHLELTMRGLLPAVAVLVFQVVCLGLLRGMFLGEGAQAAVVEPVEVAKRSPTFWNHLVPRADRHELISRQLSSGNRTKDLFDFFAPSAPPAPCGLKCELIWGAVSGCDLLSCICTERWGHEFENCVRCLAPSPTAAQTDYYQGILTEFQSDYCAGYHVPPLSLSGANSSPTVNPNVTAPSSPTLPTVSVPVVSITNDAARNVPQFVAVMVMGLVWVSVGL